MTVPTENSVLEAVPDIIRFVDYHTSIGISHVFVNAPLSPSSPLMLTLLQALSHYIDSGVLTIISTAIAGVDGASGFLGVVLQSWYASDIMQTSCLYLAKGVAAYIVVTSPTEYLALVG